MRFRILHTERAAGACKTGDIVHPGLDCYGCASDDSRATGIEFIAVSHDESGLPFFTIPKQDVERA